MARLKAAVLISGRGSNLQALIDACAGPGFPVKIATVISNQPGAPGLERARAAGIPAAVVDHRGFASRPEFETALDEAIRAAGAELVCLAGFMRVLAPVAIERFPNRIVNIHPSLLPSCPGAHAVQDALDHGVTVSGVTVHFIDEEVDHGPIIYQEPVPVLADDDEGTLHARIQEVEHRVYPRVVDALACGELVIEGRRVVWEDQ